MKSEAEILTVEDGLIKEIKLMGEHYFVYQNNVSVETNAGANKGNKIGIEAHVSIYDNILNDIKQAVTHEDAKAVIRKYYPTYKDVSLRTTATTYKRYIRKVNGDIVVRRPYHRHRRHKPEGAVAFIKPYETWVKEESIKKVKLGINKFALDYRPNFKTLLKETGLSSCQLLSTLRYLTEQGEVKKVRGDNGWEVLYQPVIRIGETPNVLTEVKQ